MADRSIKIIMSASVQGLVNGFKTAQTSAKNLNQKLVENEQAARELTTGLGLIGGAAVAGAGYAIKTFASFDKQMSNVKATGAATAGELSKLREAAVQAGAETAFSASEAAAGIENLLKAGVSAKDVLGGGLTGSLDLAAAGELGVADAAEIAATAMTQFNLSGKDVTHVADLLAAGAGKAAGDVTDIAQALNQAGLVAAQTGLSIEETTGTLSAFASAGLLGSDAGTSFKTMLQRLSAPTKENAKYMEELGISAYDAQGNFVGMSAFAGQLTDALGKMTPAQRNAALATIFGSDAVRAASVVYDQGAKGIDSWIKKVDDQGYAAETAAARLDNLQGDLEALGGAFETFFIKAGGGGNDVLRGLTQGATNLVNSLSSIDEGVLSGLTGLVGGGGLVALGVAGMGKLVVGINSAKSALGALNISAKTAGIAVGGVGAALGIAAVGLTLWAQNAAEAQARTDGYLDTLDELGKRTDTTLETVNKALTTKNQNSWLDNVFGDDPEYLIDRAEKVGLAIEDIQGYVLGESDAVEKVTAATEKYVSKQDDVLTKGDARRAAQDFLLGGLDKEASALSDAEKAQGKKAAADEAAGISQEGLQENYKTTTGAIDEQVASLESLISAQQEAAGIVLSAREAQRSYQESLDAAKKSLKENGKTLDEGTEKGRANQEALDGIAEKALKVAETMEKNGASQEKVQGSIKKARREFVDMATDMGMPIEKARDLADKLGLVPGNYKADIEVNTAAAEVQLRNFLADIESADGTLKIKGDDAPAKQKLDDVTAEVNEADGSVTIRAKDGKAIATLSDYTTKINKSDGTVTIKGKDKQGRETVLKLTSWVGKQGAAIPVKANTKGAQADVDKFIKDNTKLAIKIGTQFFAPKSAMGDGEGAGWPGATPRGVSAMSKAVKSIDPGARISSGYRPGAVTATGYPSYHGMGRAIDIVSPNMGATWDKLRRAFPMAKELFYTPRGFLRNGVMGGAAPVTRRTHYSHVHLALAKGGRVSGRGTGTSDEIPAWLSNGEHVLTASDVAKLGGQDAVYKLREAIQAGKLNLDPEPAFAKGGAVGSASRGVTQARKELAAEKADLSSLKKYLREARKKKREKQVAELEKKIDRQERAVDRAEERLAKAREKVSGLGLERTEFSRDLRRGNFMESATGGADGAYGLVDDMLGLARSGNLTKSQGNRLARQAGKAESAMRGLYKQVEKVDKRIESAAAKVEKLQGISDGVKNALMGERSLSDLVQPGEFRDVTRTNSRGETWTEQMWDAGGTTAKGLVSAKKSQASTLKSFASKLNKLRAKGLSGTILEEIGNLGATEGIQVADALLKDPGQIDDLNRAYKDVAKYAGLSGEYVTDAFSKGGLSAAKAFESGLEKQKGSLEKRIYNWGVYMANGLQAALTGKKTGLKKRARGGPVSAGDTYLVGEEGPELIVPQSSGHVMTAQQTRYLASTAHTVRSTAPAPSGSPQVNYTIGNISAVDPDAAVNRLMVKTQDAINTYGINALAQGVGV